MLLKLWNGVRFVVSWLIAGALALLILAVGRDPFMLFFRVTLGASHWADQFLNNVYFMVGGLLWLIFFLFVDHLFNTATAAGRLLRPFLRVIGIEIGVLFTLQIIRMFYYPIVFDLSFAVTLASGLLSAAMIYFGYRKQPVVLASK
jgi:hypothetical protein